MKKKVLLATLAIVFVVFLANSTLSVFAGPGEPCYATKCDRIMARGCDAICAYHGGCDGIHVTDTWCDDGICQMRFTAYCMDGFASYNNECNWPVAECIWF